MARFLFFVPFVPFVFFVSFVVAGTVASAQTPPASVPLVLEPMDNGFVLAPEVKITRFEEHTGTLAGGYGGWVKDKHLLIGGGGYWLTNDKHDTRNLAYGGLVVGWLFDPDRPVSASARTLMGIGHISETAASRGIPYCMLPEQYLCSSPYRPTYRFHRDFLVFEPQIDVQARLTRVVQLSAGAGYRFATWEHRRDPNPRGPTGSVSVQFKF